MSKEETFELLKRITFEQLREELLNHDFKTPTKKELEDFFIDRNWTSKEYKDEWIKRLRGNL